MKKITVFLTVAVLAAGAQAVAADLQDCLLMAAHDLHRLEGLLDHATDNLLARFGEANAVLTDARVDGCAELLALRTALRDDKFNAYPG